MSINRHAALAYLLLFSILALLVNFLLAPLLANLGSQHQANRSSQKQVQALQRQLSEAEQNNLSAELAMQTMLESGELIYAPKASIAGHQLQELLKSVLQNHSVTISQLRPTDETFSGGLSKSRLELNIQVPTESLEGLLVSLSQSRAKLHIELIGLRSNERRNEKFLAKTNTTKHNSLEINLVVAMWYTDDITYANTQALTLPIDSLGTYAAINSQPNVLAGLFDQGTRLRFRSPDLKLYRLAAINISQNSRIAIIANNSDGRIRRLEPGDMLDAWQVEAIDSNGVSLKIGERQGRLSLSP